MTPEQNKHIEQAAQKFYETEYNNLPGRSGNRIIGTFIAGAEYALANLSPGGWVRASERLPLMPANENSSLTLFLKIENDMEIGKLWRFNDSEFFMTTTMRKVNPEFYNCVQWYDETLSPSDKDKEIQKLRDALEWYTDAGNYLGDNGELATAWKNNENITKKAREALNTKEVKK